MNRRLVFIVQSEGRIDHIQPLVRAWPTGGVFVAGDPRVAALSLARSLNTPLLVAHPEKLLPPSEQVEAARALMDFTRENLVVLGTHSLAVHYVVNNELLRARLDGEAIEVTAYVASATGLTPLTVKDDWVDEAPLGDVHSELGMEMNRLVIRKGPPKGYATEESLAEERQAVLAADFSDPDPDT